MKFLGELFAIIIAKLIDIFTSKVAREIKNGEKVKEEGAKAEADSKESVSDLTGEDDIDFGTPETPAPIKEGENVPTKKKASDFFKHRRERNKP